MKFTIAIEPGTKRRRSASSCRICPAASALAIPSRKHSTMPARSSTPSVRYSRGRQGFAGTEVHEQMAGRQGIQGWTWGIVEVAVEKYFGPAEKINITVPALTLKRIDEYALKHGESRSGSWCVLPKSRCVRRGNMSHVSQRRYSSPELSKKWKSTFVRLRSRWQ